MSTKRKTIISKIIKNLKPGGSVEKQVLRLLNKSKRDIIKQYNATARNVKKSNYRIQRDGPKNSLRNAILNQKPHIEWHGDTLRGIVLDMSLLPWYWEVQEFGLSPQTWRQRFFIVGYRKGKLSKRGDNLILKSIRQASNKGKHIYLTVRHKKGVQARHFLRAGRVALRNSKISFVK